MGKRQDSEVLRKGEKSRQVWREAGKKWGRTKEEGTTVMGQRILTQGSGDGCGELAGNFHVGCRALTVKKPYSFLL